MSATTHNLHTVIWQMIHVILIEVQGETYFAGQYGQLLLISFNEVIIN